MYQLGKTINAVAREFKLHRTTVVASLGRHEISIRPRHMTDADVTEARKLRGTGLSYEQVGRRIGFCAQTVANRLKAQV